ncbi:MAG: extracellular solute-binding protein [Candidatus Rokubacteria bacterium]|nr:extracellular solute-binding protein [Candidatus Rokubacteria bacterium]
MLTRRSVLRLAALAPLAVARPAAAQDADWKKVVDAAKKEGKVVVYNGAVGTPVLPKVGAAFEAKYGVRFELLEARASELRERIRTEQASGKVLGDVSHNGSTTTALQLAEGTFQPHGTPPNGKRPVAPFATDDIRVPIYVITYGILVNTDMVKPGEEPKTWQDLLNPRWKGKLLSDDMRALGGGAVFFMVMTQKHGKEFHEKLAQQQPHMNRELRGNYPRVARGEYPVYFPFTLPDSLDLKGLPVKAIMPPEGSPYVRFDGAIFKGAPRPNAAKLFLDFLLSDEAQLHYANLGFVPVVGGLEGRIAAEARTIAQVKLLGTTDPKLQDDMLKLAKAIYK